MEISQDLFEGPDSTGLAIRDAMLLAKLLDYLSSFSQVVARHDGVKMVLYLIV